MRNDFSKTHIYMIGAIWLAGFVFAAAFALAPDLNFFTKGMDKIAHMAAFGFLTLWPALLIRRARTILLAVTLLFLLGISVELAQHYIPRRKPDVMDGVFNTLGIVMGLGLATLTNHIRVRTWSAPCILEKN